MSLNLIKFYFLLLPVLQFLKFSGHFSQLIISDLIFMPILFLAIFNINKLFEREFWSIFDIIYSMWSVAIIFSIFTSTDTYSSGLEIIKSLYLLLLYFSIRLLVEPRQLEDLIVYVIYSCFFWGVFAVTIWLVATFNQEATFMVSTIKTYPYFGSVYRVQLFTGSPNMFISFLLIGISFTWSKFLYLSNTSKNKLLYFVLISIILISLLLTFSRDILVVMCSILVSYYYFSSFKFTKKINIKYFVIFILFFILLLSYILLSHFVLSDKNEFAMNNLINGQYIIGSTPPVSIFSILNHDYVIYKSIYYELKIAAIRIFNESNSLGVGAGNFNESLSLLKDRNIYPRNFTSWDPHSTYFGTLSEQGILGVIVICSILLSSFIKCHTNIKNSIQINYIDIGFASLFVGISIQAICVDVMNFRHYWFIFALFATSTSLGYKFSKQAAFKT